MPKQRIVSATTFKAQCLGLIDRVAQSGEELVVTKHKRAVVRVVPAAAPVSLRGSVRYLVSDEELIAPLDERWAAIE
jgi:prevent-host-death family protein